MDDKTVAYLHAQGYRMTPQRLVVLRTLQEASDHLTPVEVYRQAQVDMPGLTEPTVYRTLSFLAQHGLILATHVGNQLVYEAAHHAHHHLVCRLCGSACEIDHALVQSLYRQFEERTGYQIDSVHLIFLGLCPDCQRAGADNCQEAV